ncbi:uncharacterized protein LOC122078188 [Macadamia integrifolia]|uniref:uncharacterized protein LOC122078188 n=1 Tax=Macadamia integrifolia TaxID=60698 RepID=UPI001C4F6063|nr:uncharacterized protein LOC122078188 [Macadamia integrifolia]XP_042500005.1 uncharacterized protein LOC122078188 [Macadamia integrifolia]XP_042500006.1 uncharacterized protein LOC122078188 [Macadamia integrifolia]XP_042500007.1 uncharacterized protein LOC122078188 [Macadamia integrifolia]XP_042500008.1 uncharacterized protein LOC122078188 [Macadamia integrifolia]XP_042500009.1 uncharacterized protein LOC122078188 [Macadamia integrifolia]
MGEALMQGQSTAVDKTANVVLDIESLLQLTDKSSGSPKMTRKLSRKGSFRIERRCHAEEEDIDEPSKKILLKVYSQLEPLKQPLITTKACTTATTIATLNGPNLMEASDGRSKRLNRLISPNPRKILLFFATVSSIGTMILIYFTLAIKRKVEHQGG